MEQVLRQTSWSAHGLIFRIRVEHGPSQMRPLRGPQRSASPSSTLQVHHQFTRRREVYRTLLLLSRGCSGGLPTKTSAPSIIMKGSARYILEGPRGIGNPGREKYQSPHLYSCRQRARPAAARIPRRNHLCGRKLRASEGLRRSVEALAPLRRHTRKSDSSSA